MHRETLTQQSIKAFNTNTILKLLEQNDAITRTEIAEETGLNKATVSTIVKELIEKNLIKDLGYGESSGGKKPKLIKFNASHKYLIIIVIERNEIEATLLDLKFKTIDSIKEDVKNTSQDKIISVIITLIDTIQRKHNLKNDKLLQIGLTIPGIVNKQGFIVDAPNLNWKNYNIIEDLTKKNPHHTYRIINEANAGALGIHYEYPEYNEIVYLSISQGVGAGIIINGQLYKGSTGYSGEVGHTIIKEHGKKCRCGQHGCLEQYVSEQALEDYLKEYNEQTTHPSYDTLKKIDQENAEKIYKKLSEHLNVGILNIARMLDPEIIILGNHIVKLRNELDIKESVINSKVYFNEEAHNSRKTGIAIIIRNRFLYGE